jgi:hypothetical protein
MKKNGKELECLSSLGRAKEVQSRKETANAKSQYQKKYRVTNIIFWYQ